MSNRYLSRYEMEGGVWLFLSDSMSPEVQERKNQLILCGEFDRKIVSRKPADYEPERYEDLELECGHVQGIDLVGEDKDIFDPSDPMFPCRICAMNFIEGKGRVGAKSRGRG